MQSKSISFVLSFFLFGTITYASQESTGPNGINSFGLGLTGDGVGIGQIESDRPGDPNFDTQAFRFNEQVEPAETFNVSLGSVSPTSNDTNEIGIHATQVAGVMISDGTLNAATVGVAVEADLFSAATDFSAFPTDQGAFPYSNY